MAQYLRCSVVLVVDFSHSLALHTTPATRQRTSKRELAYSGWPTYRMTRRAPDDEPASTGGGSERETGTSGAENAEPPSTSNGAAQTRAIAPM